MRPSPLRSGLEGLIDYAGLFPPASLELPDVLSRFQAYAAGPERWMLGRLIVPLARLDAVAAFVRALPAPPQPAWTISVLVPGDVRLETVGDAVRRFSDGCVTHGAAAVSVEYAATTAGEVDRFAAEVPAWLERYVEVPLGDAMPGLLDAVMRAGCCAKVRTGGITADRFPSSEALAVFLRDAVAPRGAIQGHRRPPSRARQSLPAHLRAGQPVGTHARFHEPARRGGDRRARTRRRHRHAQGRAGGIRALGVPHRPGCHRLAVSDGDER